MRAGVTQFPVDVFCNLPVVAGAGSFLITGPDGTHSYAYALAGQTAFYRLSLYGSPAYERVASPPAGLVFGAGVCAAYDSTRARIYVVGPGTGGADDVWTGYYNPLANTWTAADAGGTLDALLGGLWGTDGALCSPDAAINGAASSQYMYLRGGNLNTFYRFDKVADTWVAMAVPGLAGGAGCTLVWRPAWNADMIQSTHGGGSTAFVQYTISAGTWAGGTPAVVPADGAGLGTCACATPDGFTGLWRLNASGQIMAWTRTSLFPYARIYGADGVATVGSKMCTYRVGQTGSGGTTFVLVLLHGSNQIQRIRIVE